jgi:hypothetical protein
MTLPLEYHILVKCSAQRSIPARAALFAVLVLPLFLLSTCPAQIGGAVTTHSTAASTHVQHPPHRSPSNTSPGNGSPRSNGLASSYYYYPYVYAVPVPYPADITDNGPSDDDPDYQGGPTVFDRRGFGAASYVPPVSAAPDEVQAPTAAEDSSTADSDTHPEPPPEPTVLVFKDGHQLEVENYAIVNQTLYDLTPGHPRKIFLADLDLPATEKQNDDRGVAFELPSPAQAN